MASVIKCDTLKSTTGNTAITISESGVPQLQVPAFRAYLSADQSFSTTTVTLVEFDTVTGDGGFDTNNWFNTTTHRYTPQIAGYYFIGGTLRITGTNITRYGTFIYKNGEHYLQGTIVNTAATSNASSIGSSTLMYLNGSTDYVEFYGFAVATSPVFDYLGSQPTGSNVFEGFLVRAA